jgi:Site-specific recombinases, DNA invertase Pin homologs
MVLRRNKKMRVAYVRVSTIEQNEARQIEALKEFDIDKWFVEKMSGKDTDRPEFKAMMDYVREGDELYVMDLSRLSRSTTDFMQTMDKLQAKNVKLISLKEKIDTNSAMGEALVKIVAVLNELERKNMLERQAEGIKIAKENNKYHGRQYKQYDDMDLLMKKLSDVKLGKRTVSSLAKELNVTRPTIYNWLKHYEKEINYIISIL